MYRKAENLMRNLTPEVAGVFLVVSPVGIADHHDAIWVTSDG